MDTRILTYWYRILRRATPSSCLLLTLTLTGALVFPNLSVASESFRILSQNMNRLFDDVDDGKGEKVVSENKFRHRIDAAASKITGQFRLPDIIALQEVENLNVLDRISKKIFSNSGIKYYSIIREGNDISGINIGYLMHPKFQINTIRQLFKHDLLTYDQTPLFSRPPLYLHACFDSSCLYFTESAFTLDAWPAFG